VLDRVAQVDIPRSHAVDCSDLTGRRAKGGSPTRHQLVTMIDSPHHSHRVSDPATEGGGWAQIRRVRRVQVSTTTVRLNSTSDSPLVTAEGVGVIADPASRADWPCGVRAHRRPAWSINPAAVAREPATAGSRLARRSRSGSLPECHRVGRCSARRARITGRGTTTAGRLDWVLRSESSIPSIKPSEGVFCNCHCRNCGEKRCAQHKAVRSVTAASAQRARK
jgi:hypothetical protein